MRATDRFLLRRSHARRGFRVPEEARRVRASSHRKQPLLPSVTSRKSASEGAAFSNTPFICTDIDALSARAKVDQRLCSCRKRNASELLAAHDSSTRNETHSAEEALAAAKYGKHRSHGIISPISLLKSRCWRRITPSCRSPSSPERRRTLIATARRADPRSAKKANGAEVVENGSGRWYQLILGLKRTCSERSSCLGLGGIFIGSFQGCEFFVLRSP